MTTKAEQLADYIESMSLHINEKLVEAGKELRRLAPMEAILRRIAESGGLKNADLIAAREALGETK